MTMPKKEQAMKMINDNYEEREMYDSQLERKRIGEKDECQGEK